MSLRLGLQAEERAANYLQDMGFRILERNFHSRFGEIDIVAQKDGVVHFIEVKMSEKYEPLERITKKKMEKILKTIEYYRMRRALDADFCIDALVIRKGRVELIENISIM